MMSPGLHIKNKYFAFAVFPIFVFTVGDILFDLLSNWTISVTPNNKSVSLIEEAGARYAFITTQFAFIIIALAIFGFFIYDINRTFSKQSIRKLWVFYFALSFIMVLLIWKPACNMMPNSIYEKSCGLLPGHTYFLLGKEFFEKSLASIKLSQSGSVDMLVVYNYTRVVMNLGAFLAVPALIVGCVSSLGRCRTNLPVQKNGAERASTSEAQSLVSEDTILALGFQADRLKTYLFLSATLLISVVIQMIYWMQLPGFMLGKEERAGFDGLVRSITTYYGLNYTLLLCSYYIPPCLVLARRMHNCAKFHLVVAKEPLTVKSIRQWESKMGLQVVDFKSYKIIAALLAPLLPGLIGSALGAFGPK